MPLGDPASVDVSSLTVIVVKGYALHNPPDVVDPYPYLFIDVMLRSLHRCSRRSCMRCRMRPVTCSSAVVV